LVMQNIRISGTTEDSAMMKFSLKLAWWNEMVQEWLKVQSTVFHYDRIRKLMDYCTKCNKSSVVMCRNKILGTAWLSYRNLQNNRRQLLPTFIHISKQSQSYVSSAVDTESLQIHCHVETLTQC
jgi:hypothetical protein